MKEEMEIAIQGFVETLTYKGQPTVDSIYRGHSEKPVGLSAMVIDCNHPSENTVIRNRNNVETLATGEIFWVFKLRDGDDILEDAEERNDKIPDLVFNAMIKDETLGNRVPGTFTPKKLTGGLYELKNTDGIFYYVSHLTFEYKGAWIPPKITS